jgi:DNA-binding GntR family transcriptional regulator
LPSAAHHALPLRIGFPGRRPRTLGERVYLAFKEDIIRGVFPSGEAISEMLLTKRYRASRTPVREAAVRLQQENLLRIVPNRGYFVSHLSVKETIDTYEYRAALEGACAELAAQKGADQETMEQLQRLANIEYQMYDRESYLRFIVADTAFHVGIAQLTGNALLVRSVANMRCQMERIMYAAMDIRYPGEVTVREHKAVLEAIRSQDPQLARRLMIEHIFGSKDKVLQRVGGGSRLL